MYKHTHTRTHIRTNICQNTHEFCKKTPGPHPFYLLDGGWVTKAIKTNAEIMRYRTHPAGAHDMTILSARNPSTLHQSSAGGPSTQPPKCRTGVATPEMPQK